MYINFQQNFSKKTNLLNIIFFLKTNKIKSDKKYTKTHQIIPLLLKKISGKHMSPNPSIKRAAIISSLLCENSYLFKILSIYILNLRGT